MKLTIAFIYGVLLLISFLIFAGLWHWQMSGAYFLSQRPPLADFLPPFIHPGESGNFYVRAPRVIYMLWFIYLSAMFLAPAAFTWLLVRLYQKALNQRWR